MGQARRIRDAVQPDEILFVLDAMVGQDALTTAQAFLDGVGFDAVVLTKLDGDARGGAALSVRGVTGKPIMFASNGEKLEDFDLFHPERMASRILDMGDLLTLIEQAEKVFEKDQADEMAAKLASGKEFTLEDFLAQLQAVQKMGSVGKLLGMLPGMGEHKAAIRDLDDKEFDRVRAIIQSMTPAERADVKVLNASRRQRIAERVGHAGQRRQPACQPILRSAQDDEPAGPRGWDPGDGRDPGGRRRDGGAIGGPGGRGGKGKKAKAKKGKKGARQSGNPAKRAAQAKGELERRAADGHGEQQPAQSLSELPSEFTDLLGR